MARKPAPKYEPVDPGPAELSPEELWADGALTVPAAAEFIGIGKSQMWKLVRKGTVPSKMVAGRRVCPKRGLVLYLAQA